MQDKHFQLTTSYRLVCFSVANKSPCHLEDEPGPCRGLVPRYFFDSKVNECRRFFYGGCFGNANNFKTLKECQDRCQRTYMLFPLSCAFSGYSFRFEAKQCIWMVKIALVCTRLLYVLLCSLISPALWFMSRACNLLRFCTLVLEKCCFLSPCTVSLFIWLKWHLTLTWLDLWLVMSYACHVNVPHYSPYQYLNRLYI